MYSKDVSSKVVSRIVMTDKRMDRKRSSNTLRLKNCFGVFVLWLQLTCILGGTLPDYLLNEFMPDSGINLYHIAIHDTSGDIYIGGYNELFRLSGEFALLSNTSTCETSGEDCNDINKILVIDYDNDRLITCGGGNEGICKSRSLNDLMELFKSSSQVVGLGYLSAVGFIAPSQSGNALYTASSDDGGNTFNFVSKRRLNDLGSDGAMQLMPGNDIQYTTGFSHDGFSYFVSNRADLPSDVTSRLSRICQQEETTIHTFSEIHLSCSGFIYLQDVSVSPVGNDLADSLGLQPGDEVLYGVFLKSSSNPESAICIFKWIDIDLAFFEALNGCLALHDPGLDLNYELQYATGNFCPGTLALNEPQIKDLMCDTESRYTYSQGLTTEAASSQPVLELPNYNITAITTVVEQNHSIAFLGTADGNLIKAQIVDLVTSRVYETFTVDSKSVKSDLLLSEDLAYLTVLTETKVLKLHVENCAQYTTCNECIGPNAGDDGDPYCGWCTLEKKCSRQQNCASTWLPYNNAECPSIELVEPSALLYTQASQMIALDIRELPSTGSYECVFDNGVHTSRLEIGDSNTCTSPPANKIPIIPSGKDHVDIELAVKSLETGIKFLTTTFSYYDCGAINSCSECVDSPWEECRWCIEDNICKSEQCSQASQLVEHQNQTYCPQLIPGTELVPVNFRKEIVVETRSLPKGKDYKCELEIDGDKKLIPARLDEENVICDSYLYDYNEGAEDLSVPLRISWDTNIIDNEYNLTLYKCAVNRSDCSRCLSEVVTLVELDCVWCEDSTCKYNGSCDALSDVCGAPEITEVTPSSLAIEVTSSFGRDVITVTGNDLGFDEDNLLNITVNNKLCDIVDGSFNVFDQSIMCVAPVCRESEDCGEADVTINSKAGVSNTYTGLTYQNPEISDFTPKEGIMSGGTTISIDGTLLTTGSSQKVKIGDADCQVDSVTDTNIICTTASSSETGDVPLTVYFGNVSRASTQMFRFTPDPNVTVITPSTSICSGGRQLNIFGTNFDAVQVIEIIVTTENSTFRNNCTLREADVICDTPGLPVAECPTTSCDDGLSVDMQVIFDGYTYNHTQDDNTFNYKTDPKYYNFSNSYYDNFKDGSLELATKELKLKGKDLNCASDSLEVEVFVGSEVCPITTLSETLLLCTTSQDSYSNDLVTVRHGNYFLELGKVNNPRSTLWILIVSCIGAVAVIVLIVVVCLKQREQKAKRGNESVLQELDDMVKNVTEQAVVAIADMQLNLNDLAQDLEGHGMPFRGPKEYTMMMMFSGYDKRPKEADVNERNQEGLIEFSRLLLNKDFLIIFIEIINNSKMSIREKGNFASLLAIEMVVEGKLNYLTTVLELLLRRHIDDMVTERRAKQVLRRNEGATSKLLSNWVCLCMYSHLQEHNARPLYLMYQSIRCYVNRGAVDAVNHHSQHSLSLNTLLREEIEYEEIMLDVVVNSEDGEVIPVKVLSCDTINQVKEKILDVLFKNKPYSKRRPAKDVDLDWQQGFGGHLILRDLDNTSIVKDGKTRLNTMEHFNIKSGSKIGLIPKQDEANVRISQANGGLFGLENLAFNGAFDPESVIYSDEIDVELGTTVFHLVDDPEDNVSGSKSDRKVTKKKAIDELFFPRVLATKQTILEYVQNMFQSILKPASSDHRFPLAIKYLFDLFDREQRKHKVGQDVLKAWKNQSLCERFWVTVINHPEFLFDIPKTNQVKDALAVISNAFTDSCTTNQLKFSKHTDAHRLLYAKEIPIYRSLVDSFYESVQSMPELDHMAMEKQLKDTSQKFQGIFSKTSILELLYSYAEDCNTELIKALENDDACSRSRMGFRLEQIPQMLQ